ncbi:MAG: hypothetical protein AAF335_04950, partial [Bacteroidota bacterium]
FQELTEVSTLTKKQNQKAFGEFILDILTENQSKKESEKIDAYSLENIMLVYDYTSQRSVGSILFEIDKVRTQKLVDTKKLLAKTNNQLLNFIKNADTYSLFSILTLLEIFDEQEVLAVKKNGESLVSTILKGLLKNKRLKQDPIIGDVILKLIHQTDTNEAKSLLSLFFKIDPGATKKLLTGHSSNFFHHWEESIIKREGLIRFLRSTSASALLSYKEDEKSIAEIILSNLINDQSKEKKVSPVKLYDILGTLVEVELEDTPKLLSVLQIFFHANLGGTLQLLLTLEAAETSQYLDQLSSHIPSINFSGTRQKEFIDLLQSHKEKLGHGRIDKILHIKVGEQEDSPTIVKDLFQHGLPRTLRYIFTSFNKKKRSELLTQLPDHIAKKSFTDSEQAALVTFLTSKEKVLGKVLIDKILHIKVGDQANSPMIVKNLFQHGLPKILNYIFTSSDKSKKSEFLNQLPSHISKKSFTSSQQTALINFLKSKKNALGKMLTHKILNIRVGNQFNSPTIINLLFKRDKKNALPLIFHGGNDAGQLKHTFNTIQKADFENQEKEEVSTYIKSLEEANKIFAYKGNDDGLTIEGLLKVEKPTETQEDPLQKKPEEDKKKFSYTPWIISSASIITAALATWKIYLYMSKKKEKKGKSLTKGKINKKKEVKILK